MIDSHCHLDFDAFEHDRNELIARCQQAGISRIMLPGTHHAGWQQQSTLQQAQPMLDIGFGLHPYFIRDDWQQQLDYLHTLLGSIQPQAIGEIGLDASLAVPMALQQQILQIQLKLAMSYQLPIILHHRKTHHLLIQALKETQFCYGGVVHGFSGSLQQAQEYLRYGIRLGIGGTITYPRAQKTIATLKALPDDSFMLETDAPDMPLMGAQGQRNTPLQVLKVANAVAHIRGQSVDEIDQLTTTNYRATFGLSR